MLTLELRVSKYHILSTTGVRGARDYFEENIPFDQSSSWRYHRHSRFLPEKKDLSKYEF